MEDPDDSILSSVLPATHALDASNRIRDQFLNEELQYHFEDYELSYDIGGENGTAVVTHRSVANLVISPRYDAPVLTQEMPVDGTYELLEVRINEDAVEHAQFLKQTPSGLWTFSFPLKAFLTKAGTAADRSVRFERTYRITQNVARGFVVIMDRGPEHRACGSIGSIDPWNPRSWVYDGGAVMDSGKETI
jgi:hypothetical protein